MTATDLSEVVLHDIDGREVVLGDVIDRPTIIDLVRYYGCAPCRAQLMALTAHHAAIAREGGAVLGIGPRAEYQARLLVTRGRVAFPLLLDPDHRMREALALRKQSLIGWLFNLGAWWRWMRGFFSVGQGMLTGGWWEVPAILVVDAEARVQWVHRGRSMGDYPPLERTMSELRRVLHGNESADTRG